jgi:hypothetical protein
MLRLFEKTYITNKGLSLVGHEFDRDRKEYNEYDKGLRELLRDLREENVDNGYSRRFFNLDIYIDETF